MDKLEVEKVLLWKEMREKWIIIIIIKLNHVLESFKEE
jgi:outer membrane lipopolysaccharide assembly protein LptE/RlpB